MKYLFLVIAFFMSIVPAYASHVVSKDAHIDLDTRKVAHLTGEVNEDLAKAFIKELQMTADLPGDRLVVIESPGGSLEDGAAIINALLLEKHVNGTRLVCVVRHAAHSMAFNILSYCDVRLATPDSTMVIHRAAVSWITDRMTSTNLRRIADDLDRADAIFRLRNAQMLKMSLNDYDLLTDMETQSTAQGLLNRGYLQGMAVVVDP